MVEWQCATCGETWPEQGDRAAFGRAMAHRANTSRAGTPHTIRGLVDLDTGEIVVSGLNVNEAEKLGYVGPKVPRRDRGEQPPDDERPIETTPLGGGGEGVRRPPRTESFQPSAATRFDSQMLARIKGATIEIPAYMIAYAAMGMRVFTDPDTGAPYPWTAEGLAKYLTDMLRMAHERLLWLILGLTWDEYQRAEGQRLVAATIRTVEGLTGEDVARMIVAHVGEEVAAAWPLR
jgi:hypothetical protein